MTMVSITDETRLYCQDAGTGPVVLFLHGGCMSHRVWESQVKALLDADYRVVTPDLRGHGSSDKPVSPYTAEMYADDVDALLSALGIERCVLVGWSLGATIATTFASKYSDRLAKLVLVSSSIFDTIAPQSDAAPGERLPIDKMIANQRRNRPRGMERFVAGMFGTDVDEHTLRWLWSVGMQTPMRVAIKTLEIYENPQRERLRDALSELAVPGAVFHGALDGSATLDDAESIAVEVFQNGTFVAFEESGHVPFLEESEKFEDELLEFLRA
ncbi:hypothetical protein AUR64_03345 [Haloprofundus marisrubri]|uniref:AB hydrolase-1 domain-containing protein n=1 Tax=Haloprofundus marisrubri TaxID=1514971 RepID=A0A0W1RDP3_9EURY|nr:alpha/beta hydrolase [Haloprofundus marisrubri]KTG11549.1 hypothetical protein AUR64_03345 [Haloprofundus marisrubri]